jgi:diguanylate cyclase (GGDEF)-like protein
MLLAHSFGLVISAQRRLERLRRRNLQLQLVERVVALIAAKPHIRASLDEIVDAIVEAFNYDWCSASLVDDERVRVVAVRSTQSYDVENYSTVVAATGAGVMGRVAATGEPAFIKDVTTDPDYVPLAPTAGSEICLPIQAGGHVVAILNVGAAPENPLDDDDFELLSIVVNHLGIAMAGEDLLRLEIESRREIEALQRVSSIVATTLDFDQALKLIVATLADGFGYEYIGVGLIEDDFIVPQAAHGWPLARMMAAPLGAMAAGQVAQSGKALFIPRIEDAPEYASSAAKISSRITVPIRAGEDVVGILDVGGGARRPVTARDVTVLETFAQSAGMALHNARMFREMHRLATIDPITDLPNNRVFQERLSAELERATRDESVCSLLIVDVDRFKDVNDRFGHLAGDVALKALARCMLAELRKDDFLARYAGDEFVVLLPNVGRMLALDVGSRLRRAVMGAAFKVTDNVSAPLTVSIGAASYPESAANAVDLMRRADHAMYRAKRSGRNAVAFADDHGDD